MELEEYFKKENLELLFECKKYKNEFIAWADDLYSEFTSKDIYNRDWAWQFPAGHYVIIVYQRYAVYNDGVEQYINKNFQDVVSRECRHKKLKYSLITKKKNEYSIPSWKGKYVTNTVQNETDPLQNKYYLSVEEAREAAIQYSKEEENTTVIVAWYADFDMY